MSTSTPAPGPAPDGGRPTAMPPAGRVATKDRPHSGVGDRLRLWWDAQARPTQWAIGVPFLAWCGMSAHRAIGTVAAMGFPIAIAGTLGYVASGWNAPGLPRGSLGFVYVPAFVGISATSMLLAPVGARLAHRLKGPTLRRIFAAFLLVMVARLAFTA